MRGLTLVLLASVRLCAARSRGFSVFEDLLTFPQVRSKHAWHFWTAPGTDTNDAL